MKEINLVEGKLVAPEGMKVAIVASRFNEIIVNKLLGGAVDGLVRHGVDEKNIIVGDDCYFGLGVKIIGSVRIGNNVTVGANAVITKDIPDNAIVGGVPAKIIPRKSPDGEIKRLKN